MPGPAKQFDREEALARATDVFWRHGYQGTSVGDLLSAMQLSRSSMYSTFGDKKALFVEALQAWVDEAVATFIATIRGPGTIGERLIRALEEKQKLAEAHGHGGCFFGNSLAEGGMDDPDIARVLKGFSSRMSRAMISAFDDAVARGEIAAGTDTAMMATFVMTMGQGLSLVSKQDPNCLQRVAPILMRLVESDAFVKE